MKKLLATVLLFAFVSGCSCAAEREGAELVQKAQERIIPKYLAYVDRDSGLSAEDKSDVSVHIQALRDLTKKLIEALK